MSNLDVSQLEAAFDASQSGKGVRLQGVAELTQFAAYARSRAAVVCNVETFELRDNCEIARIDLSVFQGGGEEQAIPVTERIVLAGETLRGVLAAIAQEGIHCVFQVWSDDL